MASILVVDANSVERRITRMTLEVDGHRLAEAATPKDALELIRSFAFDIVMITVSSGAAHDFDLITQTRAMGGRDATQFVAILEQDDEKGPVESFMNGVSDLLIRPFGPPDLREVVQRASSPQEIDLRDRLVGIQLDAYETAIRLREQAHTDR